MNQCHCILQRQRKLRLRQKLGKLHGIDFYVPENLTIFDFTKDPNVYISDNIQFDKKFIFRTSFIFYLKSPETVGEYACQLVLKWNETVNSWGFAISEWDEKVGTKAVLFDINKPNDKISQWLTKDTTVISRIKILPQGRILIPSGIHVKLPENVFLKFDNKSGIASKRGLVVGAAVVDSDYQGEVHLNLINTYSLPVVVNAGEKIVQALPLFQPKMNEVVEEESVEELYKDTKSERGTGGFGSSGTN